MAVLPPEFAKTLPFQIFIPVCRELSLDVGKVFVCCPLISLMEDQVGKLEKIPQLTAAYTGIYFQPKYLNTKIILYVCLIKCMAD